MLFTNFTVYIHTHTDTCTSTIFVLNSLFLFELWAKLCIFYDFVFNPCLEILKVALNASLASLSCPSYVLFFLCGQQLTKTCRQNNKILLAILTMAFWICMTLCLQLYDWCYAEGIFSSFYVPVLSARRCYLILANILSLWAIHLIINGVFSLQS